MGVKPPASADTERKRQLFEGAVRTRYAILLTKAKGMAEHHPGHGRPHQRAIPIRRAHEGGPPSIDQAIQAKTRPGQVPYTRADFEAYFAEQEAAAAGA
jgi:hypothetical protein